MQAVILAGGQRSTISGEQEGIPKPMAEIGGKPLLWHIMKHFSAYGINEFVVCGGYKIETIKEYFMDFYIYESDITVDLQKNTVQIHKKRTEDWKVTVVDTGLNTFAGKRIKEIEKYIKGDSFIVTYGDCLSDIDVSEMIMCHAESGRIATVAMSRPRGRKELFAINADGSLIRGMRDSSLNVNAWVNANCYILNREVFSYLQGNYDIEKRLLQELSEAYELSVYRHEGYWTAIETVRDLVEAERLWNQNAAPWIKSKD